ncbi:Tetratricopeptide repeat protein 27 [Galdieria sulphuraria]|nr:Tetratricopeptide repeat protein 27 [Galdieria sulphuraria]
MTICHFGGNALEKNGRLNTHDFCQCLELLSSEQLKINNSFLEWLQEASAVNRKQRILQGAVACIFLFVQQNYTGPYVHLDAMENFPLISLARNVNCSELDIDGEFCNRSVQFPGLLLVPYVLLVENYELFLEFKFLGWWAFRTLRVYQTILSGKSPTLEKHAHNLISLYIDLEQLGLETSHIADQVFEKVDSNLESASLLTWKQDFLDESLRLWIV